MKGRIDLPRFVALTATNHAKLYGLYPQKGTIAVGSDADLTLWNPEERRVITNDALNHGADYTPYEGLEVQGWPVTVILRGQIAILDGHLHARPEGRYLPRKRSPLTAKDQKQGS
jgi:dihydropyrimidinase